MYKSKLCQEKWQISPQFQAVETHLKKHKDKGRRIWRLCETLDETQDYYSDTIDNLFKLSNVLLQSNVGLSEKYVFAQDALALSIEMLRKIWKPDTYVYNGKKSYLHTITTPNRWIWNKKEKMNDALFLKICSLVSKWQGSLLTEIDDKVDQ